MLLVFDVFAYWEVLKMLLVFDVFAHQKNNEMFLVIDIILYRKVMKCLLQSTKIDVFSIYLMISQRLQEQVSRIQALMTDDRCHYCCGGKTSAAIILLTNQRRGDELMLYILV